MADAITGLDAAALSAAIRLRQLSCVEVMTAYLDRIEALNPSVNAIVGLRPRADLLAEAAAKDTLLAGGRYLGWMHGFPHAVKDTADAAGLKTTMGFFRGGFDVAPAAADALHIARIRAAGAIIIGKTNVPALALGSHTDNAVFGVTGNAYRREVSAGGSSGGAAVAVALRLVPVADGSDFMGSLRNPAGWNNVLGLRPSFGRVPATGAQVFTGDGAVDGPMARTATDLALLLDTMSGYDVRAPRSLPDERAPFADGLDAGVAGARLGWLGDLGGYLPTETGVLALCRAALEYLPGLGVAVDALPGLPAADGFDGTADLWPLWLTYRHCQVGATLEPLRHIPGVAAALPAQARYEIDGLLHGPDGRGPIGVLELRDAEIKRTALYRAVLGLFDRYDYLALPSAQVFPFDVATGWPAEIAGTPMSSYHRWMEVATLATLLGVPAISIPAGFNAAGLPMGLQVLARPRGERALLRLARAWEDQTPWGVRMPPPG